MCFWTGDRYVLSSLVSKGPLLDSSIAALRGGHLCYYRMAWCFQLQIMQLIGICPHALVLRLIIQAFVLLCSFSKVRDWLLHIWVLFSVLLSWDCTPSSFKGGTALKNWSFGSSFLVSCCPGPERRWRNSSTLQASKDALSPSNLVLLVLLCFKNYQVLLLQLFFLPRFFL